MLRKGLKMTISDMFLILSSSLLPTVQYQSGLYGGNNNSSSPVSSRGNSPIVCERCGEVCRGEVVRVKKTHFHVHCFTCQGKKKTNKKLQHTYSHTNTLPYTRIRFHSHTHTHSQCFIFISFSLGLMHWVSVCGFHPLQFT